MRIRRLSAIIGVSLIVAGLLFVVFVVPQEPVSNGIRLSDILSEASNLWPIEISPGGTISGGLTNWADEQLKMINALRAMTDEALPVILRELHAHDSKLKKWLFRIGQKQSIVKLDDTSAGERRKRAFRALIGVSPLMRPGLMEMEPQVKEAVVLEAIQLLPKFSNGGDDLHEVCWLLIKAGENSRPAIPQLVELVRQHDMGVSMAVCHALDAIGEEAVPRVADLLDDSDNAPLGALFAFSHMNAELGSVLHRVASHLDDSDEDIRRLAAEILVAEAQLGPDLLAALNQRLSLEQDDQIRDFIFDRLNKHNLSAEAYTSN